MKKPPPLEIGPTAAKAVQGLNDLIQKLEQMRESLDGNSRPGSEEITEAISQAKMVLDQLNRETADANTQSLNKAILLASSVTKLIDNLLSVIFYFYQHPSYARNYSQRQHHRAAA